MLLFDRGVTGNEEILILDINGGYEVLQDDTGWFGFTPIMGMSWEFQGKSKSSSIEVT